MLALRVWPGAGLERYGLRDGDIIFIGFDDPDEGGPALAAIDDKVMIGWYRRGRGGRVTIMPFVEGTEAVSAGSDQVKVICGLKCICTIRRRIPAEGDPIRCPSRIHPASGCNRRKEIRFAWNRPGHAGGLLVESRTGFGFGACYRQRLCP